MRQALKRKILKNINKNHGNHKLMKINQPLIIRRLLLIAGSLLAAGQLQAQINITGGNLYVLQDGSGTATTYQDGGGSIAAGSGNGSAIFIDQFSTSANGLIAQTAVPTTATAGVGLLTTADTPQAGQLYYDSINNALVFGGYSGTAVGVSKSTASTGIGVVSSSGAFSFPTATSSSAFTGGSGLIRAATTDGSGNYWAAGTPATPGGVYYYGNGTPVGINTGFAGRGVGAYGGNLYYTTGSGTAGLYMFSGLPTSGANGTLIAGTGGTPYGFTFNPGMTTLYVAIENSATSGGIQKWTFNGSSWSLAYTLDSSVGFDWVTGNFSGANPVLYATSFAGTGGNSIYTITDTGSGSGATLLDTIAASSSVAGDFDGIVFVASVPEPSVYALAGLGLVLFLGNRRTRKA